MINYNHTNISHSDDCEQDIHQLIQDIPIRSAKIGQGTVIKRALPSRYKRMIGAWCFLDHAGPVHFKAGKGLDVGPHPHIGLQTFTWMIDGTMLHDDSLGSKQLIRPKQVNLMTAGYGISHTEVAPDNEIKMHAAQLWIALPDDKRNIVPRFDHYPDLPVVVKDGIEFTILVGDFLETSSPVKVYSELLGVDLTSQQATSTLLNLNPKFEYGFMVLEGEASVNGHELNDDNFLFIELGLEKIQVELAANSRVLLLGGEPFESPILLWWNFVGRTQEELAEARQQWVDGHPRFGTILAYQGPRLEAPTFPNRIKASK